MSYANSRIPQSAQQGVHEALPAVADVEGNPMTGVPDRVRL